MKDPIMRNVFSGNGFSLVEVAFSLIVFAIIMLYLNNSLSTRSSYLQSDIMAGQLKEVAVALDDYASSLDGSAKFPMEVKTSDLVTKGYLSDNINTNADFLKYEDSFLFQMGGSSRILGVTFLCLSEEGHRKYAITRDLGFGGGMFSSSNPNEIIGASGGWVINNGEYKAIFNNYIVKNNRDCVFNLSSFEPSTNKKGTLVKPKLDSRDIVISGMVAGKEVPLAGEDEWGPLFKDDALIIKNIGKQKNILVNVRNADDNRVLMSKSFGDEENKLFITGSYIGKRIRVELIPVDGAGHKGEAVSFPDISIVKFKKHFWNRITFYVRANIYNAGFTLPVSPKGGTRSDIGTCAAPDDQEESPAGIDIEGVKLDLIKSNTGASYLSTHVIALNVQGQTIINLQIRNPSDAPRNDLMWGSYDMRSNNAPLISGANVTGSGFLKLSDSCKKLDSQNINISMQIDSELYNILDKVWRGVSPLWDITPVSQ